MGTAQTCPQAILALTATGQQLQASVLCRLLSLHLSTTTLSALPGGSLPLSTSPVFILPLLSVPAEPSSSLISIAPKAAVEATSPS